MTSRRKKDSPRGSVHHALTWGLSMKKLSTRASRANQTQTMTHTIYRTGVFTDVKKKNKKSGVLTGLFLESFPADRMPGRSARV